MPKGKISDEGFDIGSSGRRPEPEKTDHRKLDRSYPLAQLREDRDEDTGVVVTEYAIDRILPDPYQGRGGVLPVEIQSQIYDGRLSPGQALAMWIEQMDRYSAYNERYQALEELANSIKENGGLINPIHIYKPAGNAKQLRIESGERRYWAHWLLVHQGYENYFLIKSILEDSLSVTRQIAENEDISALSPVGQARNIARAYLDELNVQPPSTAVVSPESLYAYYHKVTLPISELIGQKQLDHGFWKKIGRKVGKSRVSVLERLDVFRLPQAALELADAAGLNFHQLKEILGSSDSQVQADLVRVCAERNLTGAELRGLVALAENNPEAYQKAVAGMVIQERDLSKVVLRRRQSTPVQLQTRRLFQVVQGINGIGDHDYQAVAQQVRQEKPEEAEAIASTLERIARAIRSGL